MLEKMPALFIWANSPSHYKFNEYFFLNRSPTATEAANTMSTAIREDSATTSTITLVPPSGNEVVQPESIGTLAGAAVGGIIAILLILIIVLLLVLVLRRQSRNGKTFTPSNDSTTVNPAYNGKPIFPILEDIFHFKFLVMNIMILYCCFLRQCCCPSFLC